MQNNTTMLTAADLGQSESRWPDDTSQTMGLEELPYMDHLGAVNV